MHDWFQRSTIQSAVREDLQYALAVGLYVGSLVSLLLLVGLELLVASEQLVHYALVIVSATVCTGVVTWRVVQWKRLVERIGPSTYRWGLLLPPLLLFACSALISPESGTGSLDAIVPVVSLMVGLLVGMGLAMLSRIRYLHAIKESENIQCDWTARWPVTQRRWITVPVGGIVLLSVAVIFYVASKAITNEPAGTVEVLGSIFAANVLILYEQIELLLPGILKDRRYEVTPAGLFISDDMNDFLFLKFLRWDTVTGYTVTDDALVLHWRAWWRPAIRCALEDIEDIEAVTDALDQYLPGA